MRSLCGGSILPETPKKTDLSYPILPAWSPIEATPTQALSAPTATPAPQTTPAVQTESSGAQEGANAATQTAGDPAATPTAGTDASALPQASPTSESLSDDSYTAEEVHGPRPCA